MQVSHLLGHLGRLPCLLAILELILRHRDSLEVVFTQSLLIALWCLVAKAACLCLDSEFGHFVCSVQLSFGILGGCEAVLHADNNSWPLVLIIN